MVLCCFGSPWGMALWRRFACCHFQVQPSSLPPSLYLQFSGPFLWKWFLIITKPRLSCSFWRSQPKQPGQLEAGGTIGVPSLALALCRFSCYDVPFGVSRTKTNKGKRHGNSQFRLFVFCALTSRSFPLRRLLARPLSLFHEASFDLRMLLVRFPHSSFPSSELSLSLCSWTFFAFQSFLTLVFTLLFFPAPEALPSTLLLTYLFLIRMSR